MGHQQMEGFSDGFSICYFIICYLISIFCGFYFFCENKIVMQDFRFSHYPEQILPSPDSVGIYLYPPVSIA